MFVTVFTDHYSWRIVAGHISLSCYIMATFVQELSVLCLSRTFGKSQIPKVFWLGRWRSVHTSLLRESTGGYNLLWWSWLNIFTYSYSIYSIQNWPEAGDGRARQVLLHEEWLSNLAESRDPRWDIHNFSSSNGKWDTERNKRIQDVYNASQNTLNSVCIGTWYQKSEQVLQS